jgi:hypothetical protein
MIGPEGAHDFEIELGLKPSDAVIYIDGKREEHCRRIRVEQDMTGPPIVTIEVVARRVTVGGQANDVLEIAYDDGDEIIEHRVGERGVVRHYKRQVPTCHICTPS